MKNYYTLLQNNPLFEGIRTEDFLLALESFTMVHKTYKKSDIIISVGSTITSIGTVLNGSVKIVKNDIHGNQILLTEVFKNGLFAETFVCAGIQRSPVSVIATSETEIVFLDYRKILNSSSSNSIFHITLLNNVLLAMAKKNLVLNQKIEVISKKTLREKILCFLDYQRNGLKKFSITINREEMADYICADRSAMSAELSKMQKEKILLYKKNYFELL